MKTVTKKKRIGSASIWGKPRQATVETQVCPAPVPAPIKFEIITNGRRYVVRRNRAPHASPNGGLHYLPCVYGFNWWNDIQYAKHYRFYGSAARAARKLTLRAIGEKQRHAHWEVIS